VDVELVEKRRNSRDNPADPVVASNASLVVATTSYSHLHFSDTNGVVVRGFKQEFSSAGICDSQEISDRNCRRADGKFIEGHGETATALAKSLTDRIINRWGVRLTGDLVHKHLQIGNVGDDEGGARTVAGIERKPHVLILTVGVHANYATRGCKNLVWVNFLAEVIS